MPFILVFIFLSLLRADGGLLKVQWPKQSFKMQKSLKLPKNIKKRIDIVTLPVYLPRDYIYNRNIQIVSNPNFYTATIPLNGAKIMILGDRTYQKKIDTKDKKLVQKIKLLSQEYNIDEGIVATYFTKHGVNYSLTLECNNPTKDRRCKDKNFLEKVYKNLIIVGGKR